MVPLGTPVNGTFPVLVRVNICTGQAPVPVAEQPLVALGLHVVGVSVAAITGGGGGVAPNSTAPLSKAAPAGLPLPKKSVVGAGTLEAVFVPVSTVATVPDAGT
jgi:hypothetical protein